MNRSESCLDDYPMSPKKQRKKRRSVAGMKIIVVKPID